MHTVIALLAALALFAVPATAQAQYCWDTVCAAGTPAADCWRAWCPPTDIQPAYPSYAPSQSWQPAYQSPYTYQSPYAPAARITARMPVADLHEYVAELNRADETRRVGRQELSWQQQFGGR